MKKSLIFILLLGFGLRVYCSLDNHLHDWDERYHALVAKNMSENPFKPMLLKNPVLPLDFRNWDNNHVWLHKQPMALWLMALSIKVFGLNVFAVRFFSLLFSTFLIYLVYDLGKILFNNKIGIIAAFLFSINGFLLEIGSGRASTDHVDLIFLFFITLAIWISARSKHSVSPIYTIGMSISLGFALLTKWLPALIVIPVWILFSLYYRRSGTYLVNHLILIIVTCTIIALPWQLYILSTFPQESKYEYAYNVEHVFKVLGTDKSYFLYNINYLRIKYVDILYLPMILFSLLIYYNRKKHYNLKNIGIWIWAFIPLIFFSFVKTKMPAYTLFSIPALYLLTGYMWHIYNNKYNSSLLFNIISILSLFVLPLRYTFERVKPFDLRISKNILEKYDSKTIIFNDKNNIETMFFTDCYVAYPYTPDQQVIDSLTKKGFLVIKK